MEEDEEDGGDMAHLVGDNSNPQKLWWEIPKETDLLEDVFIVRSIILICIFNKRGRRAWSGIV
jgi:hypothetical protein